MTATKDEAREIAKKLIAPYVERGDSYEHLRYGSMGFYSPEAGVTFGSFGWATCRAVPASTDTITVHRIGSEDVCFHFSLRDLYDEIRRINDRGQMQLL